MRRGADQKIRKFLATAFKNDGPSVVAKHGEGGRTSTTFVVSFSGIDGPLAGDCCGLNISFYDTLSKSFVGKSHRTEVGDIPIAFHSYSSTVSIVVESIYVDHASGEEVVSCWWHTPLEGFLKQTSLKLQKGCGQLMFLDPSVWPAPAIGATLFFNVQPAADSSLLQSLIPMNTCVSEEYADLQTASAPKPFRIVLGRIAIQEQRSSGGSLFEEAGIWNGMFFVHNTHMMLAPVVEVPLTIDLHGNLVTSKEMSFSNLPLHEGTTIVCCLRFKKAHEARFRPVGYSCFDLVTGVETFCDADVNVTCLPFLRGPFSCEDPRCLSLEHERPYAAVPLMMNCRLAYHYTPIPAPVITTRLDALPVGGFVDPNAALGPKEEGDIKGSSAVGAEEKVDAATKADAPQSPRRAEKDDKDTLDLYKLLCKVMEEVQDIKRAQDSNMKKILKGGIGPMGGMGSSSGTEPASPFGGPNNNTGANLPEQPNNQRTVGIQELQLRHVAIPRRRQAAIAEGVRPLCNPQTHERLLETATIALPGDLPFDQLILRFEGVTLGKHGIPLSTSIAAAVSYSALPLQVVGPMTATSVMAEDENYGPSFQFAGADRSMGGGYMWYEPLSSATNDALREVRSKANVYIHLYDSQTMFYIASAIFKPSKLVRSGNSLIVTSTLDLTLFEDLSMAERDVPDKVPLIASTDVGYLHMTAALLGVASPAGIKDTAGGNEAAASVTAAGNGSQPKVVYVKKLPADFGDEYRAPKHEAEGNVPKPVGFEGLTEQRANLHRLRANFVRGLLQDRDSNAMAVHINGGRIPTDCEHKLRYVDKRRDEVKSTKIAEALRQRITTTHNVTAWLGMPRVVSTAFTNPYPLQTAFQLEIPTTSPNLGLHPDTSPILTLGPHETTNIKALIRVHDMATHLVPFHTQIVVRTMAREMTRIIDYNVSLVPPVINRRYEVFGTANETVSKRIHARAFPTSPNVTALGSMCHYCSVIGDGLGAETRAVVEPLTPALVAAWEEVVLSATIPAEGAQTCFLTLYKDAEMTEGWETWEVTLRAVQRFDTREVYYGQTTTIALPVLCERAYSSDPNVAAIAQRDCVVLKARPAREGVTQFHVQAVRTVTDAPSGQQRSVMERFIIHIPCVLPKPTFEDFIDIPYNQSGSTIYRLLTFANKEPRQKLFRVNTNYKMHLRVTPEQFALAPMELKQLKIELFGLNYLGGGNEGRFPMWIFINDADDLTVDSYRITVTVRDGPAAISPMM